MVTYLQTFHRLSPYCQAKLYKKNCRLDFEVYFFFYANVSQLLHSMMTNLEFPIFLFFFGGGENSFSPSIIYYHFY